MWIFYCVGGRRPYPALLKGQLYCFLYQEIFSKLSPFLWNSVTPSFSVPNLSPVLPLATLVYRCLLAGLSSPLDLWLHDGGTRTTPVTNVSPAPKSTAWASCSKSTWTIYMSYFVFNSKFVSNLELNPKSFFGSSHSFLEVTVRPNIYPALIAGYHTKVPCPGWCGSVDRGHACEPKGRPSRFPLRAHVWVVGQVPSRGRARHNGSMYLLHMDVPLPFSLPLSKDK